MMRIYNQICGSGSGRIRIILPDPDRHPGHVDPDPADMDRYQVQANEKIYPIPENFNTVS
jgi:hypothetical protein